MSKELINKYKPEFDKTLEFLKGEFQKLRTGLASPSLVDSIIVDYMGTKLPVKQLGSISCPEPRQILIQPWDRTGLEAIERAIRESDLGLSPMIDKDVIRVNLPVLTEDYRKELKRLIGEKKEATRQALRKWRQQAMDEIEAKFKAKDFTEDDKFRSRDEMQKLVDEYNKKIDDLSEKKEKEVMG